MKRNHILTGMMVGAGLAYLFDPQSGNRRRALIRDKMMYATRKTRDGAAAFSEDLTNRLYGTFASLRSWKESEPVSDEILAERVRSALGRVVSHAHAVEVSADDGCVTLRGPICADEVSSLIRKIRRVNGVRELRNELEPHEETAHVPSLQGGARRPDYGALW